MRPLLVLAIAISVVFANTATDGTAPTDYRITGTHFARSIDMLEAIYKYYNSGDLDSILLHMDDDAVIIWPSPLIAPFSGSYGLHLRNDNAQHLFRWKGKDEILRWFEAVGSVFEESEPLLHRWVLKVCYPYILLSHTSHCIGFTKAEQEGHFVAECSKKDVRFRYHFRAKYKQITFVLTVPQNI